MDAPQMKPKSFWQRPEGVTGLLFLVAILGAVGFLGMESALGGHHGQHPVYGRVRWRYWER